MVAELMLPGASASRVARLHGVSTGLLYTWRRMTMSGELLLAPMPVATPGFAPVRVEDDKPAPRQAVAADDTAAGMMVIELPRERRMRLDRHVDIEALRRVLAVLESR